jgi:hypothetical protein
MSAQFFASRSRERQRVDVSSAPYWGRDALVVFPSPTPPATRASRLQSECFALRAALRPAP